MTDEVVEEEGESRCSQAEVESKKNEALEIAELLSRESVTAEGEQLLDTWGANFNLRDSQHTPIIILFIGNVQMHFLCD